jgi:LPS-assembly lipoprotein
MKALIFSLSLLLLTSACGWQLRGSLNASLDIERIHVISQEEHTELLRELTRSLAGQGIATVGASDNPEYTLTLGDETTHKRTVGVGADTLASAFAMTIKVPYQLFNAQHVALAPPSTASITRNYDASNSAGLEREEQTLLREMRQELVQQMLRRAFILLQKDTPHDQAAQ